ncbi:hypothetical protein [Pseudogemmobacter humi]|uniref:hypothetical protein n=1 Tax=Pseudogemmobacter humi TaxID=2483812 RepID=UPI001357FBB5|nr:hypothetical protein [Pseudogemmobacter humi]
MSPWVSGGFAGFRPGQFPVTDRWPAQPASWAFSIWGPIYIALIIATIIGVMCGGADWERAAKPLTVSLAVGVFWVAAANRAPLPATIMTVSMATFAILAWVRRGQSLWQRLPLGLYAGWLTAASGVAISAALTGYGILPAQTAAILMLLEVLAVGLMILARPDSDWTCAPALLWALTGVIAANLEPMNTTIVAVASLGLVLLLATLWRQLAR